MTWQTELSTVEPHFNTEWAAAQGSLLWDNSWGSQVDVPVFYGNVEANTSQKRPWLRLVVITGDSDLAGLGGGTQRMWRTVGAVVVQIFVAVNFGEKIARQYADKVAAIFRGTRIGDLHFRAPSLIVIGAQPGGAWYQLNVNIPYYRDELT